MTMIDDDTDYRNPLLAPTPESLEGARAIVAGMSAEQVKVLLAGMQAQDREAKGRPHAPTHDARPHHDNPPFRHADEMGQRQHPHHPLAASGAAEIERKIKCPTLKSKPMY